MQSFLHFSRAIDVISICNNTKENFLREPEKIKVKSQKRHLHMQFSEFYLFFHNSCEIWHLFSRALTRNSLWCYYRELITAIALEKCKKKKRYCSNYSGTRFLSTENWNFPISWWTLFSTISDNSRSFHKISKDCRRCAKTTVDFLGETRKFIFDFIFVIK